MKRILKTILRGLWLKLTGEDPVVVSRQKESLERLNGLHVEFIDKLDSNHPELRFEISAHQRDRFNVLHPMEK